MKNLELTNNIYYLQLMEKLVDIMERVQAFPFKVNQKQSENYRIILEKIPNIIEMIFSNISSEKNKKYHLNFEQDLLKLSKILRKFNIILNQDISEFLIKSSDLKIENEGLNLLKLNILSGKISDITLFRLLLEKKLECLEQLLKKNIEMEKNFKEEDNFSRLMNEFSFNLIKNNIDLCIFCLK